MLPNPSAMLCVCVCVCLFEFVCVPFDPPEKQSQFGSILQSHSVGAPEMIDISPLVDTCGDFQKQTLHTQEIIVEQEMT